MFPFRNRPSELNDEQGFTLIELLVAMGLVAILLTLTASALRHYWLVRSLDSGRGEVVSQLRQVQERTVTESHPLVYGVRFRTNSSSWGVVKFNPTANSCSQIESRTFDTGVKVSAVSFSNISGVTAVCRGQISGAGSDQFAFFFARGTAAEGNLTLVQPSLSGRTETVRVLPITGRVEES